MLVPGANTGILVSRRNRSSETKHEWPGRQGAGARSGRETGFEKSLSPPKTHKRDTDLPQCFSSGDSGRRASGSPAVCAQVSTGPKMRRARLDHAADCCPAAAPRAPVRHLLRWPEAGSRRDPNSHRTGRSSSAPANRTSIRSASTATHRAGAEAAAEPTSCATCATCATCAIRFTLTRPALRRRPAWRPAPLPRPSVRKRLRSRHTGTPAHRHTAGTSGTPGHTGTPAHRPTVDGSSGSDDGRRRAACESGPTRGASRRPVFARRAHATVVRAGRPTGSQKRDPRS